MLTEVILSALCLLFALPTILSENPILAGSSFLGLALCQGIIFFHLDMVYLGAFSLFIYGNFFLVFYVFAIRLHQQEKCQKVFWRDKYFSILGILLAILFLGLFTLIIDDNREYFYQNFQNGLKNKDLSTLFNKYLVPFELAPMVVLGVMFICLGVLKKYSAKNIPQKGR